MQIDDTLQDRDYDLDSVDYPGDFQRLSKVKSRLIDLYHSEFLTTLINQAIDKKNRYKPVLHKALKPGDIVLLVEKHSKRYNYPMARVHKVEINSLGEVTAAFVFKGATKELVYRHVTSLIRLLSVEEASGFVATADTPTRDTLSDSVTLDCSLEKPGTIRKQPNRRAADECREKLRKQLHDL